MQRVHGFVGCGVVGVCYSRGSDGAVDDLPLALSFELGLHVSPPREVVFAAELGECSKCVPDTVCIREWGGGAWPCATAVVGRIGRSHRLGTGTRSINGRGRNVIG